MRPDLNTNGSLIAINCRNRPTVTDCQQSSAPKEASALTDISLLIFLIVGVIWICGFVVCKLADYFDLRNDNSPAKMRIRRYANQAANRD